jgi:hypothetical protein
MKLPHEDLEVFEALYHRLYTGNLLCKEFPMEPLTEEDVYCLHVYAMADHLLIRKLSLSTYSIVQDYFSKETLSMPSVRFTKELWSDCGLPVQAKSPDRVHRLSLHILFHQTSRGLLLETARSAALTVLSSEHDSVSLSLSDSPSTIRPRTAIQATSSQIT